MPHLHFLVPKSHRQTAIVLFILCTLMILLSACASNMETESASMAAEPMPGGEVEFAAMDADGGAVIEDALAQKVTSDTNEVILDADGTSQDDAGLPNVQQARNRSSNRLIIKDAQLNLLVEDTDTAIDRAQGIIVEFDGYIVSNRTWLSGQYKYATLAIGVPSDRFEDMLRRLKGISLSVTNETISGQDVSDQYVDLQSRLRNLQATADRIRELLQAATEVDKALEISDRLSEVEAEIEQIKGRMNYLQDRAAFSTITLELEPDRPRREPEPRRWSPGETFEDALEAAIEMSQGIIDMAIWAVVVGIPCLIPLVILFFIGRFFFRRLRKTRITETHLSQEDTGQNE
ncbi:MAG: DUF4349 domain-containing protein [Chloroflexota bacterium]